MSCHDIGRGMASVVDQIIEEVRNNNLDVSTARKLIKACTHGVNWCDGNEDEALQTIFKNTCGYCLKQMEPKKESLFQIIDLSWDYLEKNENANYFVCEKCLKELTKDENISFEEVKEKCTEIKANHYFKLKDLMALQFGRVSPEDILEKYGYE